MAKRNNATPINIEEKVANSDNNNNIINANITPESSTWRWVFWASFGVVALLTFYLSTQAGVNADEDWQSKYSEELVKWYSGQDNKATTLQYRNAPMYIYGGVFELLAGGLNHMMGNTVEGEEYHNIRHLLVAFFGILAFLFTALSLCRIANWRTATLGLLLMAFSPYFIGNAAMNPKDIPFAAGFAMSIYYMIRFFEDVPYRITWKIILGLIGGFTITFGMRAGGLLIFAYFGLFILIHMVANSAFSNKALFIRYFKYGALAIVGGYIGALLFWPFGLAKPLSNPLVALGEFEKLANSINVLYQGNVYQTNDLPTSYAFRSLFQTTPLVVWFAFFLSIPLFFIMLRRYNRLFVFIAFFAAAFPILYVMAKHSNLYNQWRHLLFIYPGLIMVAALALNSLYEWLTPKNQYVAYALLGLTGIAGTPPMLHVLQNSKMPYLYYNEAAGNMKQQLGKNETDYWGISMRQGIEYLEQQGILKENMDKPITIVSNMGYALGVYSKKYGDKVKWVYSDYKNRYNTKVNGKQANLRWDYGLFISLFVPADQLSAGNWPMKSSTIHTVDVAGLPVLAVMKQDTSHRVVKAREALEKNDATTALQLLKEETTQYPDNDIATRELTELQLNTGDFASAKNSADLLLKISPKNATAFYFKGMAQAQMNDINGAITTLQTGVRIDPTFSPSQELLNKLRSLKK